MMAITTFFVSLLMITVNILLIFLSILLVLCSICCIDYLFDFDIKLWLSNKLPKFRKFFKVSSEKATQVLEDLNEKCEEDQKYHERY